MRTRHRLGSSRRLVALMLVVTLVPSILLVVLGWRLFREDRDELRALQDRRARAAERVALALARGVQQVENRLARSNVASMFAGMERVPDAAVITVAGETINVLPPNRLAYLPAARSTSGDPHDAFAAGEALEYRQGDRRAAGAWYRNLARTDPFREAGARLRLARTLRHQEAFDEALATYEALVRSPSSIVEGVPSDLLARWSRCDLLAALQRNGDLEREAKTLLADLRQGRWSLSRSIYELHVDDAARWAGLARPLMPTTAESLAEAFDGLVRQRQSDSPDDPDAVNTYRRLVAAGDGLGAAILRADASRLTAFVALPSYVEREWLTPEQTWLDGHNMRVALRDPARRTADAATGVVSADESGLPWTIAVTTTDLDAELARLSRRRTLWWIALGALAAVVLAGTWLAARAVASELAMASLQSEFVSAVSHEFRTPLTSLRQIGEVLQEARVGTEDRRQDYYAAMVRQTDRLQRLVEALLDFGRMEAGATPYRREAVAMDHLVRAVASEFLDDASSREERVDVHVSSTGAVALADPAAISNAIRNLLDNAIKYSPDTREAWVDVRLEGGEVAVSVRDRGMGIPVDEQREVFHKFTRGARATAERIRGTGIGLAIVEHVVAAHGGRVTLESEPGVGSTFTIWLPAAMARAAEGVGR